MSDDGWAYLDGPGGGWSPPPDEPSNPPCVTCGAEGPTEHDLCATCLAAEEETADVPVHTMTCRCGAIVATVDVIDGRHECERGAA